MRAQCEQGTSILFYSTDVMELVHMAHRVLVLIDGPGALDARFTLVVPLALVAFGQTLVMLTRGIDLSVGGLISLGSALLATHLHGHGPLLIVELGAIVVLG